MKLRRALGSGQQGEIVALAGAIGYRDISPAWSIFFQKLERILHTYDPINTDTHIKKKKKVGSWIGEMPSLIFSYLNTISYIL